MKATYKDIRWLASKYIIAMQKYIMAVAVELLQNSQMWKVSRQCIAYDVIKTRITWFVERKQLVTSENSSSYIAIVYSQY